MSAMFSPRQLQSSETSLKLHRETETGEVSKQPVSLQVLADAIISGLGTRLAISNLSLGVAANSAPAVAGARPAALSKGKRGGARNSRNRQSTALTAAQVGNLLAAAQHAAAIGLPFNRMITIHWEAAGLAPVAMTRATGRFLDLLSKAAGRHGSRTAWLWVHEAGAGKGSHCHILTHVPSRLRKLVAGSQKRWLRSITGRAYRTGTIFSRPIGGRVGQETSNPEVHAVNLDTALAYVLKGADEGAALKHELTRLQPGGLVIGKRCGTSQNIGPKARRAKANGN